MSSIRRLPDQARDRRSACHPRHGGTPGASPGRKAAWGRGRKGVTLVLIALLMVVLVGMVGVVIDFGRFYAYRVQMQTTADAAALAGVQELARNSPATAPDSALHYVPLNIVDGGSASVPRDSVEPGIWSFASATFTPTEDFTTPGVNAVRVDARHSAAYTFGRVWDRANIGLHTTATAALGYVNTTSCVRPWAIDYRDLLNVLYPPGSKPITYRLTQADIATLSQQGPEDQITLKVDVIDPVAPGSIASVKVAVLWDTPFSYEDALDGPCPDLAIGIGATVAIDPFQASGRTKVPLDEFCSARGGIIGTPDNFTCSGAPRLKVVLWDTNNGKIGTGLLAYHVKYVGGFAVTGFHTTGLKTTVTGYFTIMPTLGAVGSTPSPLVEGILVQ